MTAPTVPNATPIMLDGRLAKSRRPTAATGYLHDMAKVMPSVSATSSKLRKRVIFQDYRTLLWVPLAVTRRPAIVPAGAGAPSRPAGRRTRRRKRCRSARKRRRRSGSRRRARTSRGR